MGGSTARAMDVAREISITRQRVFVAALCSLVFLVTSCTSGPPRVPAASPPRPPAPSSRAAITSPASSITPSASGRATDTVERDRALRRAGFGAPARRPTVDARPLSLWSANEDRIGVTRDTLTICVHYPESLAPALGFTDPDDATFYERYVNDELGGIYSRDLKIVTVDDQFKPNVATACANEKPFFSVGASTYAEICQARSQMERRRMPYLHYGTSSAGARFSFSREPGLDTIGRLVAEWILREHGPDARVAIVYNTKDCWADGKAAFVQRLRDAGVTALLVDSPWPSPNYGEEIRTLDDKDAEVVFVWEDFLEGIELMKQARAYEQAHADFRPRWIVKGYNLIPSAMKDYAVREPAMRSWSLFPPYALDGGTDYPYTDEIRLFQRVVDRNTDGTPSDEQYDLLWGLIWLPLRAIHRALLACGRDCTRNWFFSPSILNEMQVDPMCAPRFDEASRIGGRALSIGRVAVLRDGGTGGMTRYVWGPDSTAYCRTRY